MPLLSFIADFSPLRRHDAFTLMTLSPLIFHYYADIDY
jgi:hypothetical protein